MDDKVSIVSNSIKMSSSSPVKQKPKSSNSPKQEPKVESEDISMSQLELMANKKKIINQNQISVSQILNSEKQSHHQNLKTETKKRKSEKSVSSSSLSTDSSDLVEKSKKYQKRVNKENQNESIRQQKIDYLCKLDKLRDKGKRVQKMDMDHTLDDIRNEYERISTDLKTDRNVGFYKNLLLLGVQGLEMVNNKFDPLGVDLDGWSEAMGYALENQDYDEVLAELYDKYKGSGQMSPEVKLVFMIASSAAMFTISKRITKMDTSNVFGKMFSNIVKQPNPSQQQMNQQQMYQQQMNQQQMYQQQMYQQQMNQQQNNILPNRQYIPHPSDLRKEKSDTTDDLQPSKINGPTNQDDINIDNILRTMNERKREKEKELEKIIESKTNTSDDLFKSIPINNKTKGRGRGRPKTTGVNKIR
jgi:hypothetical protein